MAAPSAGAIIRMPATLVFNGTTLDTVRDIEFEPRIIYREIFNEYAGAVTGRIYCGERPVVRAVLRHPGADMISTVAADAVGAIWRFRPVNASGTRPGVDLFDNANTLVVTPRASTHPTITIFNAVPTISENARLQYQWSVEYGLEVEFHGTPDATEQVYQNG